MYYKALYTEWNTRGKLDGWMESWEVWGRSFPFPQTSPWFLLDYLNGESSKLYRLSKSTSRYPSNFFWSVHALSIEEATIFFGSGEVTVK